MSRASMTLGPLERLLLLKTLTIAAGLPAEGLVPLAQHARERLVEAGEPVIRAGEPVVSVLVVADGALTVERPTGQVRIGSGELFGALELLADAPAGTTVTAAIDTTLLEIPADTLFDVYEDHFAVFAGTLRSMAAGLMADPDGLMAAVAAAPASELRTAGDPDDLVARVRMLRGQAAFAHCRVDSLVRFAAELMTMRVDAGERLWSRGEPAASVDFIVRGEIACTAEGGSFRQHRGDYVGAVEAFAGLPRWYDAESAVPLVLLRVSIERFFDLLEDDFALARDVLADFARGALRLEAARESGLL